MVYKKFLNNVSYEDFNFMFPNTFAQNGKFLYFVEFENKANGKILGKLIKLNLLSSKTKLEENVANLSLDQPKEHNKSKNDKIYYACFANFSKMARNISD